MAETLNRADEHISEDEDYALWQYYQSNFQFQSLLDSYNHFLEHDLPLCINYPVVEFAKGKHLRFRFVKFEPSKITHHQALLEKKNFTADIVIKAEIYDKKKEEVVIETDPFVLMPVVAMVYSVADKYPLQGPQDPRIEEDPGCYFIVNGIHRIVLLKEKLRHSQYRLVKDEKTGNLHVSYLTDMPQGGVDGSTTQSTIGITSKVDKSKLRGTPLVTMNFNFTEIQTKPVAFNANVFEVVYFLMYYLQDKHDTTVEDVINFFENKLKKILPKKHLPDVFAALQSTRNTFAVSSLKEMRKSLVAHLNYSDLDKDAIANLSAKYIERAIYPSIVSTTDKINTCICMTSRLLQCYTGKIPITNRNSWSYKGSLLPGAVILHLFRKKYIGMLKKIESKISKGDIKDLNGVVGLIKNKHNMESGFLAEFTNSPIAAKTKGGFGDKRTNTAPTIITQDIYPNNTNDIRIQLYKIKADANKNVGGEDIRANKPSSFRVTAKQAVTDNDLCGLLNFLAILSKFTIDSDAESVRKILLKRKFKDSVIVTKKSGKDNTLPVFLNGILIGFTNSDTGYNNCVLLKRYGIIPRDATIVPTDAGILDIYVDAYRTLRPMFVVDKTTSKLRIYSNKYRDLWKRMSYSQWLAHGLVEFVDPYEFENPNLRFAQTFMSFTHQENDLRLMKRDLDHARNGNDKIYIANLEMQYSNMLKYRYTHADFSPIVGYGIAGALTVFPNHQQACRSAFEQKQIAQEISKLLANPYTHTNMLRSLYGMNHLIDSGVAKLMGIKGEQGGYPVIIGFDTRYLNGEDAAVVNRNAIEFGLMKYIDTMIFDHNITESKNKKEKFGRFVAPDRHPYNYRFIQENGLPVVGCTYNWKDCILNSYEVVTPEDKMALPYIRDTSRYLDADESGTVTEVVTFTNIKSTTSTHDKQTHVSVKLEKLASLERGGKISTPYSQKHIVSAIWPDVDMPFVYRNGKRMKLMVLVNAHCFITRMTNGSLLEPLIGKAIVGFGRSYGGSAHRKHDIPEIKRILREAGCRDDGIEEVYNGITGEVMEMGVFSGPSRIRMLIHLAAKKIQCRSIGNLTKNTRQAAASRKGIVKDKGNKFGEYERISALKGNAPFTVDERMNISSDAFDIVVCRNCSSYAYFDPAQNMFTCKVCGIEAEKEQNKAFGRYMYPYTSKYEEVLLYSIGYKQRIRFVAREDYLVSGKPRNPFDEDIGDELEDDPDRSEEEA